MEKKVIEFEKVFGSETFLKVCLSTLNKILVQKGITSNKELTKQLSSEIEVYKINNEVEDKEKDTNDLLSYICYLVDNCEGKTISEEKLQKWLGEFINSNYNKNKIGKMHDLS